MANKADIQTLIDTIDDGGANTAAEVRDVLNGILDEAYNTTTITDTETTSNVFTQVNTGFAYSFKVKKQGGIALFKGKITNLTSADIGGNSSEIIVNIAPEYEADTTTFFGVSSADGRNVRFLLNSNIMVLQDVITAGEGIYFNTSYSINN